MPEVNYITLYTDTAQDENKHQLAANKNTECICACAQDEQKSDLAAENRANKWHPSVGYATQKSKTKISHTNTPNDKFSKAIAIFRVATRLYDTRTTGMKSMSMKGTVKFQTKVRHRTGKG